MEYPTNGGGTILKKDENKQLTYDEGASEQVSQQIMDSYTSGVVGTEDGRYDAEEKKED